MRVYGIWCSKCKRKLARPSNKRKWLMMELGQIIYSKDFIPTKNFKGEWKEGATVICDNCEYNGGMMFKTSKGKLYSGGHNV